MAIEAYRTSLETNGAQAESLSRIVLKAKQKIWAMKETARLREMNSTLASVEGLIEAELERDLEEAKRQLERGEIGEIAYNEDTRALREEAQKKIQYVREAFKAATNGEVAERVCWPSPAPAGERCSDLSQVIPDYVVDNITFEIMHDPVVTLSGHSFDRVAITKHIEQSGVDPITRVPMSVKDLRPNYALKQVCEEFLNKNGWAADW